MLINGRLRKHRVIFLCQLFCLYSSTIYALDQNIAGDCNLQIQGNNNNIGTLNCTRGPLEKPRKIAAFKGTIYLTYDNSETQFVEFLERNNDKIVFIDSWLDASLGWVPEQFQIRDQCDVNMDAITDGKVNGLPLNIPFYKKGDDYKCSNVYIVLKIGNHTTYDVSYGGTGIVQVRFRGFFELSTTYHSGPSTHYHLKEIEAPFDLRSKYLNE